MKLSFYILPFLTALTLALPTTDSISDLAKRQCSCKKVGDEWLCSGRLCPKDAMPEPAVHLEKRQCSCHKVGDDYVCGGRLCPKDAKPEPIVQLEKRQCSCHKIGDEYICGGPKCPS